jgi:hypothetical protein
MRRGLKRHWVAHEGELDRERSRPDEKGIETIAAPLHCRRLVWDQNTSRRYTTHADGSQAGSQSTEVLSRHAPQLL